jgi:geranylgeranyl pyrophosphate synthase
MLWLSEYVDDVNSQLSKLYLGEPVLREAVADALSSGGKRVRAVLALLWNEIVSGEYKPALPLAVAYELAHASALILDDIIDGSDLRRGTYSIVSKYGLSTAILAANLLLFNVPKKMAEYSYLGGERVARLFDMLGESCRAATTGEFLDLEFAKRSNVTEQEYEEMVKLKTASMLGAPCAGGAMVGGAPDNQVSLAYRFGEELGIAYQMQDDILDLIGDRDTLGKPVFTDIRGRKKNILLMDTLKKCTESEREFISGLFGKQDYKPDEIARAREVFRRYGSVEYSLARVSSHLEGAKALLKQFKPSKPREGLLELSDYLSKRYY